MANCWPPLPAQAEAGSQAPGSGLHARNRRPAPITTPTEVLRPRASVSSWLWPNSLAENTPPFPARIPAPTRSVLANSLLSSGKHRVTKGQPRGWGGRTPTQGLGCHKQAPACTSGLQAGARKDRHTQAQQHDSSPPRGQWPGQQTTRQVAEQPFINSHSMNWSRSQAAQVWLLPHVHP